MLLASIATASISCASLYYFSCNVMNDHRKNSVFNNTFLKGGHVGDKWKLSGLLESNEKYPLWMKIYFERRAFNKTEEQVIVIDSKGDATPRKLVDATYTWSETDRKSHTASNLTFLTGGYRYHLPLDNAEINYTESTKKQRCESSYHDKKTIKANSKVFVFGELAGWTFHTEVIGSEDAVNIYVGRKYYDIQPELQFLNVFLAGLSVVGIVLSAALAADAF